MHFLIFSQHFDRERGQDYGRLLLNHLEKGTLNIWVSTSSVASKQDHEDFHQRGGLIPPQYRLSNPSQPTKWTVKTKPIPMPHVKGVSGNFYKIDPHMVTTDKGGSRGDFGIHLDANVEGSMGCVVMNSRRFSDFEDKMKDLALAGIDQIPLFVVYS